MRSARLPVVVLAALVIGAISTGAFAQSGRPGYGMMGGGGYSDGYGTGGPGMMGPGSGYHNAYGAPEDRSLTFSQALRLLSRRSATVDRARRRVTFTGRRVLLAMAAVQPGYPDTTFEVAGLVDPTIVIPAGSTVTLSLVNMDYGRNMDHGVEITAVGPPYPVLGMMGMPGALSGIPVLRPRSANDVHSSHYRASSVTFDAPPPGVYYYICQYFDHASKGMYGKLVVRGG